MKKILKKHILNLALSIVLIMAAVTQGKGPILLGKNTDRIESVFITTVSQSPILLAKDTENTAGEKTIEATAVDDQLAEPASGPQTDREDPSARSEPAPLKPFNPSEEIAAEQAVDFPVDI
jgi:hypothetical protein